MFIMPTLNQTTIAGRLTRDPEMKWIRTQHIVRCSASSTDLIAGRLSEVYNKLVEKLDSIKEYENE